jgi:hypothetical protein
MSFGRPIEVEPPLDVTRRTEPVDEYDGRAATALSVVDAKRADLDES